MHVCHPSFGENTGLDDVLDKLIETAPKLCSTDAQVLLRDRYETLEGIYDHDNPNGQHPFALVAQHWNEDTITNGPLHERITQYLDQEILRHFGLSIDEFLERPTYMCELLLKIASERNRKEAPVVDAALAAMKK